MGLSEVKKTSSWATTHASGTYPPMNVDDHKTVLSLFDISRCLNGHIGCLA